MTFSCLWQTTVQQLYSYNHSSASKYLVIFGSDFSQSRSKYLSFLQYLKAIKGINSSLPCKVTQK